MPERHPRKLLLRFPYQCTRDIFGKVGTVGEYISIGDVRRCTKGRGVAAELSLGPFDIRFDEPAISEKVDDCQ